MSQFPITPQQDYQSIITTTGKGYQQSIQKQQLRASNITLVDGFVSGLPLSGSFFTCNPAGDTLTFTKPVSVLDLTVTFTANSSISSYYIGLLRLQINGVTKDYADYPSISSGTAVKSTWKKVLYENINVGDTAVFYINNAGTALTNIVLQDFNLFIP